MHNLRTEMMKYVVIRSLVFNLRVHYSARVSSAVQSSHFSIANHLSCHLSRRAHITRVSEWNLKCSQVKSRCCWTSRDSRLLWPRRSCAACGSTGSASSVSSGLRLTSSNATCRTTTRSCRSTGPTQAAAVDRTHCNRSLWRTMEQITAPPTAVPVRAAHPPGSRLPSPRASFCPSPGRPTIFCTLETHTMYMYIACT